MLSSVRVSHQPAAIRTSPVAWPCSTDTYRHRRPPRGAFLKARLFHRVLKRALLNVESLLPHITDLELRGYGGVNKPGALLERDRFLQEIGELQLKVPGVALAHGYQSTIAWIADEIDLYLHPQATLIPALYENRPTGVMGRSCAQVANLSSALSPGI